jgi:hexokinase
MRYIRAFFITLRMMLRGERPAVTSPYPAFDAWVSAGVEQVNAVYAAAEKHQINAAQRAALTLKIDGRNTNVEVMLGTIRHHMVVEYPYVLTHNTRNHLAAIYSNNFNDQYWVEKLQALPALQAADVQAALAALKAHLDALPPLPGSTPEN